MIVWVYIDAFWYCGSDYAFYKSLGHPALFSPSILHSLSLYIYIISVLVLRCVCLEVSLPYAIADLHISIDQYYLAHCQSKY